jgi:hypothetical protein
MKKMKKNLMKEASRQRGKLAGQMPLACSPKVEPDAMRV